MVIYDDADQGIIPGTEGYFSREREPSSGQEGFAGTLLDYGVSRSEQLEFPFDGAPIKIRQHPAMGLVALLGLSVTASSFFDTQRAAGVQDPALDVLEDLLRGPKEE